jgi:hypothetical protein
LDDLLGVAVVTEAMVYFFFKKKLYVGGGVSPTYLNGEGLSAALAFLPCASVSPHLQGYGESIRGQLLIGWGRENVNHSMKKNFGRVLLKISEIPQK